jgi:hypothetical protein
MALLWQWVKEVLVKQLLLHISLPYLQKEVIKFLLTTDPAAHINDFINQLDERPENLTVERIDRRLKFILTIFTNKKVINEDAKSYY